MSKARTHPNPMISQRIKEVRISRKPKITQQDLADLVGVEPQTIHVWESGAQGIPQKQLERISEVLQVPFEYLIGKTDICNLAEFQEKEEERAYVENLASTVGLKLAEENKNSKEAFKTLFKILISKTSVREDGKTTRYIKLGSRYWLKEKEFEDMMENIRQYIAFCCYKSNNQQLKEGRSVPPFDEKDLWIYDPAQEREDRIRHQINMLEAKAKEEAESNGEH